MVARSRPRPERVAAPAPWDGSGSRKPTTLAGCAHCFAWGITYSRGVCLACYDFAGKSAPGECAACTCELPLKRGYCRLCWTQALLDRPGGPRAPLAPHLQKITHHQLFIAGFTRHRQLTAKKPPSGRGRPGPPLKAPPPAVTRPVCWAQLKLFDARREYRYGQIDMRRSTPDNPWLAWALHLAHTRAETRGFTPKIHRALNRNLAMLLADHRDGETIRASDIGRVLRQRRASIEHTSEILAEMDLLLDDLTPSFETWLERKLDGLAPAISTDTESWVRSLRDGGPRRRPRKPRTAQSYLVVALPFLRDWSDRYTHLRQVTREDILHRTETLQGPELGTTLVALRSLFAWAKKNGAIFRDPTKGIKLTRFDPPILQPLTQQEIDKATTMASTPQARLAVCLATIYAARSGAIRALTLDDVDLGNRRLTITGRERPLDELTHRILTEWLDYRRERWPNTANPHVIISTRSALHHRPVSVNWFTELLRGLNATIERLHMDRHLEEALASGGDPLHLASVFDMDETTAIRYAISARQLLRETTRDTTRCS
jgi:site-specific recombinase XerD